MQKLNARPLQPNIDQPLECGLTIREILESIFAGSERTTWCFESRSDEGFFLEKLIARNERTGFSVHWSKSEFYCEDSNDSDIEFLIELQIGDVWVSCDWTRPSSADQAEIAHICALSEDVFVSACALIGKRAVRKLVVL